MRFHGLRHTAATLLMAEGVNVKGEMLGHADVTIDTANLLARPADDAGRRR